MDIRPVIHNPAANGVAANPVVSVSFAGGEVLPMSPEESIVLESLRQLRPEVDYEAARDLVAEGLIDSFDIVSLVTDLESRFNVKIDGVEIVPENFQTVGAIAALVRRSERRS